MPLHMFEIESLPEMNELPRERDAVSEPITIGEKMIFGDHFVSQCYVSGLYTNHRL